MLNNFHEVAIFKEFMLKINLYDFPLNIKIVLFCSKEYIIHISCEVVVIGVTTRVDVKKRRI